MKTTALFSIPKPKPNALLRLVCFSYAGGGSAAYLPWLELLHPDVELVTCQLPGRGARLFETPYDHMEPLVHDLCDSIRHFCSLPLVFFGHSMGSKVAYELCLAMQCNSLPLPVQVVVSAAPAPFHMRRKAPIHDLPDVEFISALSELNGTPQQVLNNPELMALFLPALRADFKLIENYINTSRKITPTRLTLMGGTMDKAVSELELADWNILFAHAAPIRWVEGDHFYIIHKAHSALKQLNEILYLEILRAKASANLY